MLDQFQVQNKLRIMIQSNIETPFYNRQDNILFLPNIYDWKNDYLSFIKHYSYGNLRISSIDLITREVIEAIKDNPHIYAIELGSEKEPYTLTREVFDLLNESNSLYKITTSLVTGEYSIREMELLTFFNQTMVGEYSIVDLKSFSSFVFRDPLLDREISYLEQYLGRDVTIDFRYDDYSNILKVIQKLEGRNITFNILENEALSLYSKQFQDVIQHKEKIYMNHSTKLDQYLFMHSFLDIMVADVKNSNMSMYEKYLAVFQIVTHYKLFQENEQNKNSARLLEHVLFNNFGVCYGFSELLVALLDKVGIKAFNVSFELYKESEKIHLSDLARLNKEELNRKLGNVEYHSRVIVRLIDPKYHIDGIFFADPTWDNSLESHYFNHSLMTPYETTLEFTRFYDTDVSIFNISSMEEFLNKIKLLPNSIFYFLEVIQNIDFSYYVYLKKNYDFDVEDYDFLLDAYNYIIKYTKKSVSKDARFQALEILFQFIYPDLTEVEKEQYLVLLQEKNQKRDEQFFRKGGR